MRTWLLLTPIALTLSLAPACSNYKESGGENDPVGMHSAAVQSTIDRFQREDPALDRFFNDAYAYAVFPEITKGAAGVGAANGEGLVYEQGQVVGWSTVTQITVGLQLGGQTFGEIVFFQDRDSFQRFKNEDLEFSANASAVAVRSGAAAQADYQEGVAVFTMPRAGLMFEASIGGQKFTFRPLDR